MFSWVFTLVSVWGSFEGYASPLLPQNWLVMAQNVSCLFKHGYLFLQFHYDLGIVINMEKSNLESKHSLVYQSMLILHGGGKSSS